MQIRIHRRLLALGLSILTCLGASSTMAATAAPAVGGAMRFNVTPAIR